MNTNQRGSFLPIIGILVLLIVVGGGAYYLGSRNNKTQPEPTSLPQASTTPLASPSSMPTTAPPIQSQIPNDWTYHKSSLCNISIPVPPKVEPYYTFSYPSGGAADDNGRYWKLVENNESEIFFFKDDSAVHFVPADEAAPGNDYNPGSVAVFCTPNTDQLTTAQLVNKLESYFTEQNYDFKLLNKRNVTKWDKSVLAVNIQGGMFNETEDVYLFASKTHLYFIDYAANSENKFVRDTAKKILDNLQFIN